MLQTDIIVFITIDLIQRIKLLKPSFNSELLEYAFD